MNDNLNERECASQNRLILAHLRTGATITGIEALNLYGCFRLPSRICVSAKQDTPSSQGS